MARSYNRYWTRETILSSFSEWADLHGRAPRSSDISSSGGRLPYYKAVAREFPDGWRSAVVAAGMTPCLRGRPPKQPMPEIRCVCGELMTEATEGMMCGFCRAELDERVAA